MLAKKVTVPAGIAFMAGVASGLAAAAAAVMKFQRPVDTWPAWLEMFSLAAFVVALGAAIVAYTNAPATPSGWRPARRWSFDRFAPAVVYFAFLILDLAMHKAASPPTSELFWKIFTGTIAEFAFALVVWENWWIWREFDTGAAAEHSAR
jgi:hypothetical protein